MQVALCRCALSHCIISSPVTAGFLSAVLFAALHTPDALQCLHCSVWLMAAFMLHASCSILHWPRRCDACNGMCVCLFLVCSVVLACFTLLMLSSLLALAPGDLLLVSPSSRCSRRRLCVYIVQPSRLAACRFACAHCRAWHETPRAAFAKQSKSWILLIRQAGCPVMG